jgi:hypothetical protein
VAKKKKPLLPPKRLLLKRRLRLRKLQLLLLPLTLLLPLLTLLLLRLTPLLLRLTLLLLRLTPLLLPLPSNSGIRNEKPAFGPVFFRLRFAASFLQKRIQPGNRLDQPRERLGIGHAQIALRLVLAKIEAGGHRDPGLIEQGLRKLKAVFGMGLAVGV